MNLFIGTDIEEIARFAKIINLRKKVLKRFFFQKEINYVFKKGKSLQSLAGIWCAKEAVVKAFGQLRSISITDVEVLCAKNSAPKVTVRSDSVKGLKFVVEISISHTKEWATATAILVILE